MDNDVMRVFLELKAHNFLNKHHVDYHSKGSNVITNSLGYNPLYKEHIIKYLNKKFNKDDVLELINEVTNVTSFTIVAHKLYNECDIGHLRSIKKMSENLMLLERNILKMTIRREFFFNVLVLSLKCTIVMQMILSQTDYELTYDKSISMLYKIIHSLWSSNIKPFKFDTFGTWIQVLMIINASSGTVSKSLDLEPRLVIPRTLAALGKYKLEEEYPERRSWLSSVVIKRADILSWDNIYVLSSVLVFIWDDYTKYKEDYI